MANTNKVRFGLKNVYYALIDTETGEYKAPVRLPGAVSLTIDAEGDTSTFYADDIAYYVTSSNAGYSGSIELAALSDQALIDLLGQEKDDNGFLYERADANPASFALLYEIDGDPDKNRGVLYNVKLTRPSTEANTKEDSTDPQTVSADFNAIAKTFKINNVDVDIIKGSAESSATAAYENFFTKVYTPTKAAA